MEARDASEVRALAVRAVSDRCQTVVRTSEGLAVVESSLGGTGGLCGRGGFDWHRAGGNVSASEGYIYICAA